MANVLRAGESVTFSSFYKVVRSGSKVKPITSWPYAERLFLDVCDAPIGPSSSWLFRRFMW
jgi:hypothetical protein